MRNGGILFKIFVFSVATVPVTCRPTDHSMQPHSSYLQLPYVPLFQALSRFFHRKSRFLLQSNRTDLTKFMDFSNFFLAKAGSRDAALGLIVEAKVQMV